MTAAGARAARLEVDPSIRPTLMVPPGTLSTHLARGLLPDVVPHAESLDLVDRLRARGLAAVVSGAGPSVLVLAGTGDAAEEAADLVPDGWTAMHLEVDSQGARLLADGSEASSA